MSIPQEVVKQKPQPDAAKPLPYTAADIRRGFLDTTVLWLGVAPFGVAYALIALQAGLDGWQTQAMSLLVFAGASQFAGAGLFATKTDPFSIILATFVINLRHLLLTATLAPALRHLPWWQRASLAFQVTDESFAIAVRQVTARTAGPGRVLGANLSLYFIWQVSTLIGIIFGNVVSDELKLGLSLFFPLSFTVMLLPYLKTRPMWAAAVVGGAVALAGRLLIAGNWYVLFGAVAGSLVGYWLDRGQAQ